MPTIHPEPGMAIHSLPFLSVFRFIKTNVRTGQPPQHPSMQTDRLFPHTTLPATQYQTKTQKLCRLGLHNHISRSAKLSYRYATAIGGSKMGTSLYQNTFCCYLQADKVSVPTWINSALSFFICWKFITNRQFPCQLLHSCVHASTFTREDSNADLISYCRK